MLVPTLLVSIIVYTDKAPSVIGAVTANQEESNILGTYFIMPSFKAKISYNLEDEYKKISNKLDEIIEKCKNDNDIEKCLKDNAKEWDCLELKDEASAILYDFIDKFNECLSLKEDGVVCRFSLDEREITSLARSFDIMLTNENQKTRVDLKQGNIVKTDYVNLEYLVYTDFDNRDTLSERINPMTIMIEFQGRKPVIKDVFAIDDNSNRIPLSKTLLVYKKDKNVKFVEATGSSFEAPIPANKIIDVPQTKGVKFCAKTGSKVYAYDKLDNTVKLRDVVYKFAVTFPISVPLPIENLEVIDAPKAENSVILMWDKGKESNIKSYSMYYSKNDFRNLKMDDIKKDNNIFKKTIPNEPVEVKDIDINNCIINPVGKPCKFSIYNNALEKDKLYYLTSKNKLIYLLSDSLNLKDDIEYNFAVTAVNEVNKELNNDKSVKGNTYVLAADKNYKKSMPMDDLAPSSEGIVVFSPSYDENSKKVRFNFGDIPKTNVDSSEAKDFKNYKIYYAKYIALSQKQKSDAVNSILNGQLKNIKFLQSVNYEQPRQPFFVDISATIPQSNEVYFFFVVASDNSGNPKEEKYKVNELGATPFEIDI